MPFKYANLLARLEANSTYGDYIPKGLTTPCKIWRGKRTPDGYGVITYRVKTGSNKGKVISLPVHKVAMVVLYKKPLENGHDVSHLCNNRACWQGEHLIGEPHADNVDRIKRR